MTTAHTDNINELLIEREKEVERTLLGMVIAGKEQKKGHIMEHLCSEMFIDKTNLEVFEMIQDQLDK